MAPEIVPRLRYEYWEKYGTTSRGLQLLHGLDMDDYMQYVHDVPLSDYIGPDPALDAALRSLPQRKVIFTNATAAHAQAVLGVLGVAHHFEAVFDVYFAGNQGKPAFGSYRRLLDALDVPGHKCLMAEDTARNLLPARQLGMTTVLVDPPPGGDVDGADYVIDRVADITRVVADLSRVPPDGTRPG
jgi:putative hydrolase of the HAD superfamily